jgi:hypothetical protein
MVELNVCFSIDSPTDLERFISACNEGKGVVIQGKFGIIDPSILPGYDRLAKRAFLAELCKAVSRQGGFGKWSWAVSFDPNDLSKIIEERAKGGGE